MEYLRCVVLLLHEGLVLIMKSSWSALRNFAKASFFFVCSSTVYNAYKLLN